MSIKAIIFDLDNTLYDESVYILAVFQLFAKNNQIDAAPVLSNYHKGLRKNNSDILEELLRMAGANNSANHIELFNYYASASVDVSLAETIKSLLKELRDKGYKLGLLTNGVISVQQNKVRILDVARYFDDIQYARSRGSEFEKPHQSAFKHSCMALGTEPHQTLMVGDDQVNDIQGAVKVGLKTYYLGNEITDEHTDLLGLPRWLLKNAN
ncbi:MAG: putative hydrolase of the HAD superfamily [Paraglaciecola sp.]|jgi:putative hydrolase of the HAD superfamily